MSSAGRLVFGAVSGNARVREDQEALSAWLEKNADLTLETKQAARYEDLVVSVREGSTDVAWLPPVVYARLAEGVTPIGSIVREGKTAYASALVVGASSKIHTPADLRGVRAGWVDPWSAAGFVVPRLELAKGGLDPRRMFSSERFFGQHREALLALARGACDVTATFARLPEVGELPKEGGWSDVPEADVRVVATYGPIPADVIAVRRNLDPKQYERVARAFAMACGDDTARPLVRAVFGGDTLHEGIEPGHDALRLAYERGIATGLFD